MGKKNPANQGKTRTRQHVLEDLSINHVERFVFLEGHTVERIQRDYGLDLIMTTYDERGVIEPDWITLQVKATDQMKVLKDGKNISLVIQKQHLKHWLRKILPVILVVYEGPGNRAYWLYVQAYFQKFPSHQLFGLPDNVTVHIPLSNRINRRAIRKFRQFRDQVREEIGEADHHV